METFIFYCRVCGARLETTEWAPRHSFNLVTGKPEYTKFHQCHNDRTGEFPVDHTIMYEIGYMMDDGTINPVSCEERRWR